MEQSESSLSPICAAVFSEQLLLPVFVPLNGNVLTKLEELQHEKEELKQPAPASSC